LMARDNKGTCHESTRCKSLEGTLCKDTKGKQREMCCRTQFPGGGGENLGETSAEPAPLDWHPLGAEM